MFVDEARILVASGRGGNGAATFSREKGRGKGGPDGGNGGAGGSVILVADAGVDSLAPLKDNPHRRGRPGENGRSNNRTGAVAPDLEVKVPVGTVVADEEGNLLADLAEERQRFAAARGGRGGRGNMAFLSEKRRAPGFAEFGEPGEERWLRLELRLIADVAVIGFPNAGKSTLVSQVSAARPKVADYPFTTLDPSIGVVEVQGRRFSICDIPGLIEGAHEGKGLGLKFLRHAQRALVFLHIVDLTAERDPVEDYRTVRSELRRFREELLERRDVVALNKLDAVDSTRAQRALADLRELERIEAFPISAKEGTGLESLVLLLAEEVEKARTEAKRSDGFELFRTVPDERISVRRENSAWRIKGRRIERWVAMTDMNNSEAVSYLQGRLERAGVEAALGEAGAKMGDEVRIGDVSFEWWPAGAAPE